MAFIPWSFANSDKTQSVAHEFDANVRNSQSPSKTCVLDWERSDGLRTSQTCLLRHLQVGIIKYQSKKASAREPFLLIFRPNVITDFIKGGLFYARNVRAGDIKFFCHVTLGIVSSAFVKTVAKHYDLPLPIGEDAADRLGDLDRVIIHQDYIRGFYGRVTAQCAHGDPDIRPGQDRRVINAVADKRRAAIAADFFKRRQLILRQQLCMHFADAKLLRRGLRFQ